MKCCDDDKDRAKHRKYVAQRALQIFDGHAVLDLDFVGSEYLASNPTYGDKEVFLFI